MYVSIIIIYERFEFMQRKFNSFTDGSPLLFYEDVYLLDKCGNVILYRQGFDRKIKNIYEIIDRDELDFIKDNITFSNINPLLLVSANDGLVFLDLSLLSKKGIWIAIIPHFSREKTLEIIKLGCSFVLSSPKIQKELQFSIKRDLSDNERIFANRLKMLYRAEIYNSQTHGKTNIELADMMLELVYNFSSFIGCEVECNVCGISIFELKNELCIYSYKFMLFLLCFASYVYSENRCAKIDIHFDKMGIFMNVSFEVDDIYLNTNFDTMTWLNNLINYAKDDKLLLEYTQNNKEILLCGYLWQYSADYEHIKKKSANIISL